ncbi:MAG: hypothetical protein LBH43_08755 [Treponema sp.]|jgi:uroporphyrinogen decarboxylase|nr:hypothetical protein [Treponema sp.]
MFVPDCQNIVKAAKNEKPARIPLYEHSISPEIMEKIQGKEFAELAGGGFNDKKEFYRHYNKFFIDMGYDAVNHECWAGPVMPGSGSLGGHKEGEIQNRNDFDKYPWDSVPALFFERYREDLRAFGETLPGGIKGIGGIGNGVLECVEEITGYENLCYIRADDEELYRLLFQKTGDMLAAIFTMFLKEYGGLYCVCRLGDDLGFKSSTLLPPEDIREFIIPQYRRIIDAVHAAGKPLLLHSCGCIFSVMDDLIEAGIDSKHSNEEVISPYSRWIDGYGARIGNFGGIDAGALYDSSSVDIVSYTTEVYKLCEAKGHGAAIGTGHSITSYSSAERYCQMVDTVRRLRGD